jgi:hypothetical protein
MSYKPHFIQTRILFFALFLIDELNLRTKTVFCISTLWESYSSPRNQPDEDLLHSSYNGNCIFLCNHFKYNCQKKSGSSDILCSIHFNLYSYFRTFTNFCMKNQVTMA